jgi:DNA repair exonuclease SbcCD ATPase subunit
MARGGFFAGLQRAARAAARESERRARQSAREHAALVRRVEQTRNADTRAQAQLAKADAAHRKLREKEAHEAHLEAMLAEVEERNQQLAEVYEDIDTLLEATLSRDDYVDLNTLRVVVTHPPFDRTHLEAPTPEPRPIPNPREPVLSLPEAPRGLASLFGKKKHAEAVQEVRSAHERELGEWKVKCREAEARRQKAKTDHESVEEKRVTDLERERARYAKECEGREAEAAGRNRDLDEFIANLGYGTADAVQEYVSIVLSNSVYPEHFQVTHEFELEQAAAELRLRVLVPGPSEIPDTKAYKYSKSSDEITSATLSQKECRERFASAVHQVALRSFHEVFESDRRGLIQTISLEVGTNTVDPATGNPTYVPFVIAAAERQAFLAFDLSAVVPALTLGHLGAALSKNPFGLVGAERAGVRRA